MAIFSSSDPVRTSKGDRTGPAGYIRGSIGKPETTPTEALPVESLKPPLRVAHFPPSRNNPYQDLMFRSLRSHSVEASCVAGSGAFQLLKYALAGSHDILHLHWTSGAAVLCSLPVAIIRITVFHAALLIWRLRRKRIVWTVHNLVNHERKRVWLDKINSRLVSRHAHRLIVHGERAKRLVSNEFLVPERKIGVVPHGNYEGIMKFQPVRKRCDKGVHFAYFGSIRAYKGIPDLIRAFSQIEGKHQLRIAGQPVSNDLHREVEDECRKAPRVVCKLKNISNDELAKLFAWSDVIVLPYKSIMTSGSLLMALTAGRPIIVPRMGLIPEYVDEKMAFFYEPNDCDDLVGALYRAAVCPSLADMAYASRARSRELSWEKISPDLVRIYREVMASIHPYPAVGGC